MAGITLDTGALIALERRDLRITQVWQASLKTKTLITIPSVVLLEWWRGQTGVVARILDYVDVEPVDERLAKIAGEALAQVRGATAIDAAVMASAARRGDIVYTSDFDDLTRLRDVFPSVRVLRV